METKRFRPLGKGSDKTQLTVVLGVTEAGFVLPPQYIFEGKTTRCCLNTVPTKQQTEETFIIYIQRVLLPYKVEMKLYRERVYLRIK